MIMPPRKQANPHDLSSSDSRDAQSIERGLKMEQAPSFDRELFFQTYLSRFAEFHFMWTVFFVGHMSDVRRQFDDLEDALLLSALGMNPLAEILKLSKAQGDPVSHAFGSFPRIHAPTNAMRLAELTSIPRQTVRRKLKAFAAKGWVEQKADGTWHIKQNNDGGSAVSQDLLSLNAKLIQDISRLIESFIQKMPKT